MKDIKVPITIDNQRPLLPDNKADIKPKIVIIKTTFFDTLIVL